MKQFAVSLLVLGIPFWLPDTTPTVLAHSEVVLQQVTPSAQPGVVFVSADSADGEQRGWLGVSIDAVPEALATQLEIPEGGVLILNVVKDGPADQSGIQVHDVILSVDGQNVDEDTSRLVELISSRKPGDEVEVVVMRQGQKKIMKVELGARPGREAMAWKFDVDPQTKIEERIRTRGKIMGKGPSGEWFIKDLGDLDQLADLKDQIKVLVPHSGSQSTQVFVDGNRKTVKIDVRDDGSSVNINQEEDGEITVTRTDKDGKDTTASYDDEDALKAGDPEAYELFAGTGSGAFLHLDIDALGKHGEITVDAGEWKEKLEEGLREAQEAMEKAKDEMDKAHQEMAKKWQTWQGAFVQPHDGRSDPGAAPMILRGIEGMGKAKQSFKVMPDGTIEVRIRKGDSEVVRVFSNVNDMAKRDPKLHEKYQDVMSAEE